MPLVRVLLVTFHKPELGISMKRPFIMGEIVSLSGGLSMLSAKEKLNRRGLSIHPLTCLFPVKQPASRSRRLHCGFSWSLNAVTGTPGTIWECVHVLQFAFFFWFTSLPSRLNKAPGIQTHAHTHTHTKHTFSWV